MLDPLDYENRPFYERLMRRKRSAYRAILIESVTSHIWRAVFWCLLFAGLWMLEAPQFFGMSGAVFFALLFFAGILFFIKADLLAFAWPDETQIDKRLEESSNLKAGELATLDDKLANPEKHATRNLWQEAQKKALALLPSLRAPYPRALLAREDPYGLRLLALLIFTCGLLVSGPEWQNRIYSGLVPVTPTFILSQGGKSADLWVKPPDYTGLSPMHLSGSAHDGAILAIPEGSTVKIRVASLLGPYAPPVLLAGKHKIPLTYYEDGMYGAELPVPADAVRLKIRQLLLTRAAWDYKYVIDTPPEIHQTDPEKPFEVFPNGPLRFPLTVQDDYGVTSLDLSVNLDDMVIDKPLGDPYTETRLVMSPAATPFEIQPIYNLTWHTWAGLPVTATFSVTDHKGQKATLGPIKLTLPERAFRHPLAQTLIAMRKSLAWGDRQNFFEVARNIEALLNTPGLFQDDIVIFLALRAASSRLYYADQSPFDNPVDTAKAVIALLWDTALAVEDGDLSLAMRNLRDAQKALENALRNPDASDEEIARLMQNLREQMGEYLTELQRDMQKRMAQGGDVPDIPQAMLEQMMNSNEFARMLQKLESDLMAGDKDSAREMLSQLQRMMDALDPSLAGDLPQDMQMMMQGVNELQELIQRQEELLGQTREQADDMDAGAFADSLPLDDAILKNLDLGDFPPPPQDTPKDSSGFPGQNSDPAKTQAGKAEQEALRYVLGQLMLDSSEQLDEIPESMGLAEQEMRGSEDALGAGDPVGSIPHQEKALEYLKESQNELNQMLKGRMQQMIVMGFGGVKFDPLGRPYASDGAGDGTGREKVEIPDEAQRKHIEEILRILRERSGDLERPYEAREYFRRLLRQF